MDPQKHPHVNNWRSDFDFACAFTVNLDLDLDLDLDFLLLAQCLILKEINLVPSVRENLFVLRLDYASSSMSHVEPFSVTIKNIMFHYLHIYFAK